MNKPFFRIILSSILLTQLPACGFHLRGYDAPMSQNIPTTELIFNNTPEAYAVKNSLKKQLATSSQGTTADATTIEVMAQTNPLIRSIIDGKINFYVEPIPYYAADGVKEKVKSLTDWMDSIPLWNQVYNEASADLSIGWIRDYGHKALGITYSKNTIEVGLGTQTCTGEWAPFNDNTIYHVLWHEVGHSMGYLHSNDQNNIMYYNFPQQFYPDTENSDQWNYDGDAEGDVLPGGVVGVVPRLSRHRCFTGQGIGERKFHRAAGVASFIVNKAVGKVHRVHFFFARPEANTVSDLICYVDSQRI